MRHAIALNGSFFNTQRMLQQYVLRAYFDVEPLSFSEDDALRCYVEML